MAGICKVTLIGNIGREPELRTTAGGKSVANFSVATSVRKAGEEQTLWHRVTCYDKLADIASQYAKKGRQVYIDGKLNYSTYTDKQGVERTVTEIIANELQLLGGRNEPAEEKPKAKPQAEDTEIPF